MSPVDKLTRPHALDAPARGRHLAQLYTRDEGLVRVVGDFVMAGLERGEGIVLIATAAHRAAIARHLEDHGFTPSVLARGRQLILLDARETLEALRVGPVPARPRFETVIGGAIEACRRAGFERLRAFVEMVDLIRRDNDLEAVLLLEGLWNDLVAARGLTACAATGSTRSILRPTRGSCSASAPYTRTSRPSRTPRASSTRSSAPTWTCSAPGGMPRSFGGSSSPTTRDLRACRTLRRRSWRPTSSSPRPPRPS